MSQIFAPGPCVHGCKASSRVYGRPGFYPLIFGMMALSLALRKLFSTGLAGGMVTYGALVSGIGSGLFVSAFSHWLDDKDDSDPLP